MSVQSEFIEFNKKIKLDYETRNELADKRDILVKKLQESGKLPSFEKIDQGSYALHLGVEPLQEKEYDIDVGLRFKENKSDYSPLELKKVICDILEKHTEYGAHIKKPCVTITYSEEGEPAYHVDLVVYLYEDKNDAGSQMYLARGKYSDNECWEKTDPIGLINYINNAVEIGEARDQFRRSVRYLKRWKNIRFDSNGHGEPPSIGITLILADYFQFEANNDLLALKNVVKQMLSLFKIEKYDNENNRMLYRLEYVIPSSLKFEYGTDVFKKMTDVQMTDFKDKLDKLFRDLEGVENELDELEQCKKLQKIFGEDFNVPEAKSVSRQQHNYIPASSSSGKMKW